MAFKPSLYQIFLTLVAITLIVLLLFPNLIFPENDEGSVRIGIVDSGCSLNQQNNVAESVTYTTIEYGYNYDETSVYDTVGHGRIVCDLIISGTEDVSIYSAKIANSNGQLTYQGLFEAVTYLIEEKNVDIINLSLGSEPYFSPEILSSFESFAQSTVFVAAVGNKANDFQHPEGIVDWPSTLPWVIGVGSIETSGIRSFYSSYGRSDTGIITTEFSESGTHDGASGTSFAAPRITASIANLWQELEENKISVTPELINYYLAKSSSSIEYNYETGWGKPQDNNFNLTNSGVLLNGYNELDIFPRFSAEQWTKRWKVTGTIENIGVTISGNGSDTIEEIEVIENHWGKILEIQFLAPTISEIFNVEISHPQGNNFTYSYQTTGEEANYSVLLDHRNTVNGFAHTWGIYSNFEKHMRENGVLIDQTYIETRELTNFDSVIVTEFGKFSFLDLEFLREFNPTLFNEYITYTENGGNLQIMATYPDQFYGNEYIDALAQLGGKITDTRIPNGADNQGFASNFTSQLLFDGVDSIGTSGSSIEPVNTTQSIIGWFSASIANDRSIGVNTTIGTGTVFIWSGSVHLQNEYFLDDLTNYDRFLLNYLDFYSN